MFHYQSRQNVKHFALWYLAGASGIFSFYLKLVFFIWKERETEIKSLLFSYLVVKGEEEDSWSFKTFVETLLVSATSILIKYRQKSETRKDQ